MADLFHRMGEAITLIADHLADEGDRVYLGSTNHADMLKELRQLYFEYRYLKEPAHDR